MASDKRDAVINGVAATAGTAIITGLEVSGGLALAKTSAGVVGTGALGLVTVTATPAVVVGVGIGLAGVIAAGTTYAAAKGVGSLWNWATT